MNPHFHFQNKIDRKSKTFRISNRIANLLLTSKASLIFEIKTITCRDVQRSIEKLQVPPEGSKPLHFSSQFAQSQLVQYWELTKRNFTSYSRNPAYNGTR